MLATLMAACFFFSGTAVANSGKTPARNETDARPEGFVDVVQFIPGVIADIRYASTFNFTGVTINGYEAPKCLLTREAATALKKVREVLAEENLTLKIFDCYRPQRAVDHFVAWAKVLTDTRMKARFYPNVDKSALFEKGYIAAQSGHSRGSTVDLTLVSLGGSTGVGELDMGTAYDFFDPLSHTDNPDVSDAARANRQRLKTAMEAQGFVNLPEEWWHYTLKDEPYPDRYFNFPVK